MEVSDQRLLKIVNEFERVAEKVAVMTGERGVDGRAITSSQLSPLSNIATSLSANELTSAPTASDFNALLKDVRSIHLQLIQIAQVISNSA